MFQRILIRFKENLNPFFEKAYNSIIDYALWYYYMTGYQRAWDVAMMSGDFLLRFQDPMAPEGPYPAEPPVYKGRNGMGRGAMAITLYRATHRRATHRRATRHGATHRRANHHCATHHGAAHYRR